MELLKPKDNLTFSVADVKFFIRPQMTVGDKFEIDMVGEYKDGVFKVPRTAIFNKVIELFVTGWDGITEDGKPVPYSYDTFMGRMPADVTQDIVLKLGAFIVDAINLLPKDAGEKKNESPVP